MPIRLVIADDEVIIRMDLKEMLCSLGYVVVAEASDGHNAIKLARDLRPDLVIMDVKMPGLDGIEAAGTLTAEHIAPVVLVTAYSDKCLVARAKDAGVVGYVVKPFQESDLAPCIEIALARYREFELMERKFADIGDTLETRKIVEKAKDLLMDRKGLKEEDAFRKIQRLSMNTPKTMREVAEAILLTDEL